MHKKGALDLPINLLVTIIISIVILMSGIALMYQFIKGSEDIQAQLDERTTQELERLLVQQGKQVALPFHQATLQRGEQHVFGLGILNIGGKETGAQFKVTVELFKVTNDAEQDLTSQINKQDVESWLLYRQEVFIVKENDHHSEPILIKVHNDALQGIYIFRVKVLLASGQLYGNPQQFIVNVV